jgi:hypothetical protein
MPGRHEGDVEILMMLPAAGIAGIDLRDAEARHMHGKFIDGDEWCPRLLADHHGIAGVIFMAVGQRHMGYTLGHVPHRVA